MYDELPSKVIDLMGSASISNFVSINKDGVPIDTPVLCFMNDALHSLDMATGLSYPAKAERARRNPKVGMLIEGNENEPIISISGMATVKDQDLQNNLVRYLSETAYTLPHDPPWPLARKAIWYWARIFIEVIPKTICWWNRPCEMESLPNRWDAPEELSVRSSDPAGDSPKSRSPDWEILPWESLARQALARSAPSHLSIVDKDGFPKVVCTRLIKTSESGFTLSVPRGLPWECVGSACITFGGVETFLGKIETLNSFNELEFYVEKVLPIFSMTKDMRNLWNPDHNTRKELMQRLFSELGRRKCKLPVVPIQRPPPTTNYKRRMERLRKLSQL